VLVMLLRHGIRSWMASELAVAVDRTLMRTIGTRDHSQSWGWPKYPRLLILSAVVLPFNAKHVLALFLPGAVLSVFIGCILSCCPGSVENPSAHLSVSAQTSVVSDNCDECPFANELSCGSSHRESSPKRSGSDAHSVLGLRTSSNRGYFGGEPLLVTPPSTHGPPLERSFALRI